MSDPTNGFPLMKHCDACGTMHGVDYVCPVKTAQMIQKMMDAFANGSATPDDLEPKGIFAEEKQNPFPPSPKYTVSKPIFTGDLSYPPPESPKEFHPMILPKPAPGATVWINGPGGKPINIGDLSFHDVQIAGGLVEALKAKLKSAPTAEVADAFFLAFVAESTRHPLQSPRLAELTPYLDLHFGVTRPTMERLAGDSAVAR